MKIDGSCHCGNITYEAETDPDQVIICHCTDCQSLSGSAFRTVVFTAEEKFRFITGTPRLYVKTAQSGNMREQVFCPDCGSPFYSTSVGPGPGVLGVRVGTVRQRDRLIPKKQYWTRSAQGWTAGLASIDVVENGGGLVTGRSTGQ